MTDRLTTKLKILNAAEKLFAERGFSDTSLRQITQYAQVNLASVNYHFGSKNALIQAVLARYLDALIPRLSQAFCELDQRSDITLQLIFETMVPPILVLDQDHENGTAIFLQLLGRGYIESQGHLRGFITHHYGQQLQLISVLVHRAAPHLAPVDVFWRLHFALGTAVFCMSSFKALSEIAQTDFAQQNDVDSLIRRVIPYVAAGVAAPAHDV